MRGKRTFALGAAAVTAATLSATAVITADSAGAAPPAGIPVVTVHMGAHISLPNGNTLHAGRIIFRVTTSKGSHSLQIVRLHRGYSPQQFGSDIGKAFSGDTAAIARVDDRATWRGGAETHPNKPGRFGVTLSAGHFFFIDQNSNAVASVNVVGKAPNRPTIPVAGKITAFTYGFEATPASIPAHSRIYFRNQSDQPHFLEMQRVAQNTTPAMVRAALSPRASGNPAFLRHGSTSSGVISPGFGQMLKIDVPAGKYLIACFWPDRMTGMPHAFMGMWKLIQVG
jgi:hypothetical protein